MTKPLWVDLPFDDLTAPIVAIAIGPEGVWAGGLGGVALYSEQDGWRPPTSNIAIHSVTALAYEDECLLAGHESGIARSTDGGRTWSEANVGTFHTTVTALAISPRFSEDGVVLAATFGNGILKSSDSGRSWRPSNFGLDEGEVMALVWVENETVLAGTKSGLLHSPNGGRAWRAVPETPGISFSAITILPDGGVLAAPTLGRPFRFSKDLRNWQPVEALPDGIPVWALATLSDGRILAGSGNHGLWASADSAQTWSQLWQREIWSLAGDGDRLFAGTNSGLAASEDRGLTWSLLPPPPIHQLQWLLPIEEKIVLAGVHSSRVRRFADGRWWNDDAGPNPISGVWRSGDNSYITAAWNGLYHYEDGIEGLCVSEEANCTRATFLGNDGWAGISSDRNLLRTRDGGRTWNGAPSPFGNLALVALQAFPNIDDGQFGYLMAATYDESRRAVKVWRSDDGERWTPGADSFTPWPHVATLGEPGVVTIGSLISTRQRDGSWVQISVGETPFRRIVTDGSVMYALALDALWRSDDLGQSWVRDDEGLPSDEMLDVAIFEHRLHVLLTGGRLIAIR